MKSGITNCYYLYNRLITVSYAIYLAEREVLAVGNYLLIKEEQDEALKENYEERYELD